MMHASQLCLSQRTPNGWGLLDPYHMQANFVFKPLLYYIVCWTEHAYYKELVQTGWCSKGCAAQTSCLLRLWPVAVRHPGLHMHSPSLYLQTSTRRSQPNTHFNAQS